MTNKEELRMWIIKNMMSREKLQQYEDTFGYLPANTKSGWGKEGFRVISAYPESVPVPNELTRAQALKAERYYEETSNRAIKDYHGNLRSAKSHANAASEHAMDRIPMWVKIKDSWRKIPVGIFTRRQVEPVYKHESFGSVADLRKRLAAQKGE